MHYLANNTIHLKKAFSYVLLPLNADISGNVCLVYMS